ncbi:TPA: lipopolysaccharide biosynthesis protein [Streptococcus suis]|nr:lipopolysaccharide biosynthesis protein [Streptococcus suis]HEM6560987.1 lipopolysaccharide biosynthesis protein [Streptococcus suis]
MIVSSINKNVSRNKIYFWNLLGNIFASGVSVLYLMVVSRLLSADMADQFSLASSIGSLWIVIGLFQVRNFQGTDVNGKYTLRDYFQTRVVTIGLMLVTIVPYLYIIGNGEYSAELVTLTILFLLYRTGDALSDVFQGFLQQIGRLDIAGMLMTYRYLISIIIFYVTISLTKSINFAIICLIIFTFFYIILIEGYFVKQNTYFAWRMILEKWNWVGIINILKACSPLFINGYLLLSVLNQPKIVIEKGMQLGLLETGIQRDFNILFMPVFFMSMCILVIRPQITNMAYLWGRKDYAQFSLSLKKMFLGLGVVGGISVIASNIIGIPILSLVFGVDLSKYVLELTILVLSGSVYSIAIAIENVLTIFRRHSSLVVTYIFIFLLSSIIYQPLIFKFGILGASVAFIVVMIAYILGTITTYWIVIKQERGRNV